MDTHTHKHVYCDEEIWHPNTFVRQRTMVTGKNQRTIVVSRIMERNTLSPTLSIIAGWCGRGRASLSISHVCVGGDAGLRPYLGTEEEPAKKKKKSTRGEFSNYGKKVSGRLFLEGWRRIKNCLYTSKNQEHMIWRNPKSEIIPRREPWEKRKNLSFEWTSTPRHGKSR